MPPIAPDQPQSLCFAHASFDFRQALARRAGDFPAPWQSARHVKTRESLLAALAETEVLVISHLWDNAFLDLAPRLRYVQTTSSGVNNLDTAALAARGVRLASATGVNRLAVADHAFGLLLSLTRKLAQRRDEQRAGLWRPQPFQADTREEELAGKTLLLVGLGAIGGRIAELARVFGMRVIALRRDPGRGAGPADQVAGFADLPGLLPQADVVLLCCPLTDATRNLIDAAAFAAMKPSAYLVNVARGACVDEPALIAALDAGRIAGAAIDVTVEEPLAPQSPLWSLPGLVLTPHSAGETRAYEGRVLDILAENLARLDAGRDDLLNRMA